MRLSAMNVCAGSINICVHLAGSYTHSTNNAVLLLHGFPDSSKLWDSQVQYTHCKQQQQQQAAPVASIP
jgi:pimeloyl-ACP methyl ester carboxylesterase